MSPEASKAKSVMILRRLSWIVPALFFAGAIIAYMTLDNPVSVVAAVGLTLFGLADHVALRLIANQIEKNA